MIIKTRSENKTTLSLTIDSIDCDTGEITFAITIHYPGHYNKNTVGHFKTACNIYEDMEVQYFDPMDVSELLAEYETEFKGQIGF